MAKKQLNEYKHFDDKDLEPMTTEEFDKLIENSEEYQEYKDLTLEEVKQKCVQEVLAKLNPET